MSVVGGGQYAFVIQTRDNLDRSWSWISTYGNLGGGAVGRGVEDDAEGTPREFGRTRFDACLDHLVAEAPGAVDYFCSTTTTTPSGASWCGTFRPPATTS